MKRLNEKMEFATVLRAEIVAACAGKDIPSRSATIELARALMRAAVTLHRLAENDCNGFQDWQGNWDEAGQVANDRKVERLEARVTAMLAPFGITPRFGGDPRGCVFAIVLPCTQVANGWGSDGGYCVPR